MSKPLLRTSHRNPTVARPPSIQRWLFWRVDDFSKSHLTVLDTHTNATFTVFPNCLYFTRPVSSPLSYRKVL